MKKTALLIIDVQKGFDHPKWGERNNLNAEEHMQYILGIARKKQWEVIHVQHASKLDLSPLNPNQSGFEFKDCVKPLATEKTIIKNVNSAFIGKDLERYLHQKEITDIIIIGLTTPHCVSTTARMSSNLGFSTFVVEDATASFALQDHQGNTHSSEVIHQTTLATLHGEFAKIIMTRDISSL